MKENIDLIVVFFIFVGALFLVTFLINHTENNEINSDKLYVSAEELMVEQTTEETTTEIITEETTLQESTFQETTTQNNNDEETITDNDHSIFIQPVETKENPSGFIISCHSYNDIEEDKQNIKIKYIPTDLYERLFEVVKDKDYFVLTTNVDHCFQKAGFDKARLFYTQGDYGLFQCSKPCHNETYDNAEIIKKMVLSQGFSIENGELIKPKNGEIKRTVPTELIPKCPKCGRPMSMNLRADNTFVQDEGWYKASEEYESFMERQRGKKVVFIELGVGYNTPGIIKYNFWRYANNWQNAFYVCINKGEAYVPREIEDKGIGINEDIKKVVEELNS